MSIIKLSQAGESVTWKITGSETVAGKFGAQAKFTNDAGDVLYVSLETAERQLERCGLTVASAAGETLVFSRDENKKTPGAAPYWSIKLAGAVDKAPPSKRLPSPSGFSKGVVPGLDDEGLPPEPVEDESPYDNPGPIPPFHKPSVAVAPIAQEKAKIVRAYLDLFAWMRTQPEVKDVPLDVVQSISATVWIEWNKRGLVK